MNPIKEHAKYLHLVFNWKVKDCDVPAVSVSGKECMINAIGYWQAIVDMEDFKLYDIKVVENPKALRNNVFKSGLFTIPEMTPATGWEFEVAHESYHSKQTVTPILNIAIGKDDVFSKPTLPDEELMRLYHSVMSVHEVVKVLEDANLIGKAAQIMLDYWQDEREENGELRGLHVFEKALKCKSPKQIQTELLRDPLEDSFVTFDELIEQGFSYEVIKSVVSVPAYNV